MAKKFGEYEFDPFESTGIKVPKAKRKEALEEVADYVKEQILSRTGDGRTSVKGGKWARNLSPEYLKKKKEESGVGFANLELYGDMLDSLDTRIKGKGKIVIEVGDDQRGKAEGHITGIYGKNDSGKRRQFMPVEGEEFAPEIERGIKQILKRYEEE